MSHKHVLWCSTVALSLCGCIHAQLWSGVLSPARATDWTNAGVIGGIPSGSWTQCGSTIAPYGSSGAPASPATINNAITACGSNQYVLLASGDFYLNGAINLKTNVALRGAGANATKLHFIGSFSSCNGNGGAVCFLGTTAFGGYCNVGQWPCPSGHWFTSGEHIANWTAGFAQGSTQITLDSVAGIIPNVTPIVLDQCDTGFMGSPGVEYCTGSAGAITAASVISGGSGYVVGDTGTIGCQTIAGSCFGGVPLATYQVTAVNAGAVTSFSITSPGGAYTLTDLDTTFSTGSSPTSRVSGVGSGLTVNITAITPYDNGGFLSCAVGMVCEYLSQANTSRNARSQSEVVLATAIAGSGPYTVTLSHSIMQPNWASSQGPQAWWGSTAITNSGVENLFIDLTGATGSAGNGQVGVQMSGASNIWVKGIASSTANVFHVMMTQGVTNTTIRDSYFYWTKNGGTTSYGIGTGGQVSNCLIENNIIQGVVDPIVFSGTGAGCAVSYNYAVNQWDLSSAVAFSSNPMHAAASNYILEEGNVGSGVNQDAVHGPHLADTFYRNYFAGYMANNGVATYQATIPITVGALSRYNNYIGNVLGTPGYHTVYQCIPASASQRYCSTDFGTGPGGVHIWDIGWAHQAQLDYTDNPPFQNDTLTASSFMRWGNWDSVTNAVQWNISEVPTADSHFPISVPTQGGSGGPMPASFIYSSQPSWWPSGKAWPPIGPDVSTGNIGQCTGGTYPLAKATSGGQCTGGTFRTPANTAASHAVSIPAMDCFLNIMGGHPDGTGSMLSFNASSCYSSGSGLANPPASVSSVVR